jgi:hypothetical protein
MIEVLRAQNPKGVIKDNVLLPRDRPLHRQVSEGWYTVRLEPFRSFDRAKIAFGIFDGRQACGKAIGTASESSLAVQSQKTLELVTSLFE